LQTYGVFGYASQDQVNGGKNHHLGGRLQDKAEFGLQNGSDQGDKIDP
jgi:hypothetical protein